MNYEIIKNFIKENRSWKKFKATGMTLHDTGNIGGDTDEGNWSWFNRAYRGASAHGFIDDDSITQFIPLDEQAWHAGPTANKQFIGWEMCNTKKGQEGFNNIYAKTVWVFAKIFIEEIGITTITKNNLMSHNEISKKWGETNHVDPDAYLAKYGKSIDIFRKDVQNKINELLKVTPRTDIILILKKGSKGNDVLILQSLLNNYGFELVVDGDFGDRTETAVKIFQKDNGLTVTGIVEKTTMDIIRNNGKFADHDKIPSWNLEAALWAKKFGIVKGNEKGEYMPEKPITRSEFIQVLYNYHKRNSGN